MTDTALLIIDIQNDYFPGGAMQLEGADDAGARAAKVLEKFRNDKLPIIHVRTLQLGPSTVLVAIKIAVEPDARAADVAKAIDAAEIRIREAVPEATYVFIEPDIRRADP